MESDVPISAVDCYFKESDKTLLLLIGDEKGYVKVSDITCCVRHFNLEKVVLDTESVKRNPKFKFFEDESSLLKLEDEIDDYGKRDAYQ